MRTFYVTPKPEMQPNRAYHNNVRLKEGRVYPVLEILQTEVTGIIKLLIGAEDGQLHYARTNEVLFVGFEQVEDNEIEELVFKSQTVKQFKGKNK